MYCAKKQTPQSYSLREACLRNVQSVKYDDALNTSRAGQKTCLFFFLSPAMCLVFTSNILPEAPPSSLHLPTLDCASKWTDTEVAGEGSAGPLAL
jgi:hypothetical protein